MFKDGVVFFFWVVKAGRNLPAYTTYGEGTVFRNVGT